MKNSVGLLLLAADIIIVAIGAFFLFRSHRRSHPDEDLVASRIIVTGKSITIAGLPLATAIIPGHDIAARMGIILLCWTAGFALLGYGGHVDARAATQKREDASLS